MVIADGLFSHRRIGPKVNVRARRFGPSRASDDELPSSGGADPRNVVVSAAVLSTIVLGTVILGNGGRRLPWPATTGLR